MNTLTTARAQVARQSADMDSFYILMQESGQLQTEADNLMELRNRALCAYNTACSELGRHNPTVQALYSVYVNAADDWLHVQSRADGKRNLARSYAR